MFTQWQLRWKMGWTLFVKCRRLNQKAEKMLCYFYSHLYFSPHLQHIYTVSTYSYSPLIHQHRLCYLQAQSVFSSKRNMYVCSISACSTSYSYPQRLSALKAPARCRIYLVHLASALYRYGNRSRVDPVGFRGPDLLPAETYRTKWRRVWPVQISFNVCK